MQVQEAIRLRRSVRRYLDRPIEDEKLMQVLEAARLAPSARNLQNWKFIVVKDEKTRAKLAEYARNQDFIAKAPIVIAACGTDTDYKMTCGQFAYTINVAIAIDHMTLAALELGLSTCWIGAFYEDNVKDLLGVPKDVSVVALLPLGYAAEEPMTTPRKPIDEIVSYEKYKN